MAKRVYSLRLDEETVGALEARAERTGRTPSSILRDAAVAYSGGVTRPSAPSPVSFLDEQPRRVADDAGGDPGERPIQVARTYARLIADLCIASGVSRLVVFGSSAREHDLTADSDVDVLATFVEREDPLWPRRMALLAGLTSLFRRFVDLTEVHDALDPGLLAVIAREGVTIYGDERAT